MFVPVGGDAGEVCEQDSYRLDFISTGAGDADAAVRGFFPDFMQYTRGYSPPWASAAAATAALLCSDDVVVCSSPVGGDNGEVYEQGSYHLNFITSDETRDHSIAAACGGAEHGESDHPFRNAMAVGGHEASSPHTGKVLTGEQNAPGESDASDDD